MALINRIARLVTADFHAVLDQVEEPVQLLRQSIRDMEEEIAGAARRIEGVRQTLDGLAARRSDAEAKIDELDGQLDLCFDSGNEALAKKLVRRKLQSERLLKQIVQRCEEGERKLAALEETQSGNCTALDNLKQKAELFAERPQASADHVTPFAAEAQVGDDEVEIAFLAEQSRRGGS